MSEFELSDLCRQNNNAARKELYELYAGQMMAICLRYVGDRDIAQDLLHDGFLKIFKSFDKFMYRGDGSLKAWISRIMVNISLEYLRRNDILKHTMVLDDVSEVGESHEDEDVNQIPQKILMEFINELPPGYRTVFNLYTFEEKSHKEIAQTLGINEKSSASQLFRAKNVLAKRIKNHLKELE